MCVRARVWHTKKQHCELNPNEIQKWHTFFSSQQYALFPWSETQLTRITPLQQYKKEATNKKQ